MGLHVFANYIDVFEIHSKSCLTHCHNINILPERKEVIKAAFQVYFIENVAEMDTKIIESSIFAYSCIGTFQDIGTRTTISNLDFLENIDFENDTPNVMVNKLHNFELSDEDVCVIDKARKEQAELEQEFRELLSKVHALLKIASSDLA